MPPEKKPATPARSQTCGTASCCCECRKFCGDAGIHRDDTPVTGSHATGPPAESSWLGERPWIWFWVSFILLLAVWTCFIVLAAKHQPTSVPLRSHG